jgi:hypothetical protein
MPPSSQLSRPQESVAPHSLARKGVGVPNSGDGSYTLVLCDSDSPVPEFIDPVFAKTSQNARFLLTENERFGLVFVKTGSINSGTEAIVSLFQSLNLAG